MKQWLADYEQVTSVVDEQALLAAVRRVLKAFVGSHAGLSRSASLDLSFELPVRRPALKSAYSAWRQYPVTAAGVLRVCPEVTRQQLFETGWASLRPTDREFVDEVLQERRSDLLFEVDLQGRPAALRPPCRRRARPSAWRPSHPCR